MAPRVPPVNAEKLARTSLILDAAYCALGGAAVALLHERVARAMRIDERVVISVGLITVGWAAVVGRMSALDDWQTATLAVCGANVAAATTLAGLGVKRPRGRARALLAVTACEVAAFAVSQAGAVAHPAH